MSELKSYKMVEEKYCTDCVCVIPSEVYLKSEADKVIAELKEKYNELAKLHDKAIQACCDADKVIAHHKYKRCLAMAKWCEAENYTACWYHENSERCEWTEKWHNRWLKLAEKFKEAK